MRVQGRAVADNADRLTRKVALAADAAVVLGTPVDTGRARSNWQAELDKPAEGEVNPFSPGEAGSTGGQNARSAIGAAAAVVSKYNGDRNREIHLTNNLPYIGRLNDGWSAQAPAGFVEEAVHAGAAQIKGASLLITKSTE